MKKFLTLSLIVFCTVFAVSAQDIVNLHIDRQQMGLRGAVASVDEDILLRKDYFRDDWPTRKWFVKDLRNILREEDGRIIAFNQQGRPVTITYTHQGRQGKKTSCSYASNGLLSSYVGEGYKVEARYKDHTADINVYAETKDYKSPNLAKADLNLTPYSNSYPFDLKCRQELGDDGIVLKSSYFFVDSLPAKVYEYDYNFNNQLVSEKCTDFLSGEKVTSFVRYTYDNKGFLTKKVVHSKAVDETWTYVNNQLGDCTQLTIERPYGTVVYTFEYYYDDQENWTVRLQFQDGVFDNAALRSISYFKNSGKESLSQSSAKSQKQADKEAKAAAKKAEREAKAAACAADKEANELAKAAAKEERERIKEAEKNMTKEERKEAQQQRKAVEAAKKEKAAAEKQAEKDRIAAEKQAEKDRKAAERQAEKERKAAEKQAKKDSKAEE